MAQGGKIDSRAYKKEECVVEGKGFWAEGSKGDRRRGEEEGGGERDRGEGKMPGLPGKLIRVLYKGRPGSREAQINKRGTEMPGGIGRKERKDPKT